MQLYFLLVLLSSLAYAQEYVLQTSFAGGPTFLDNFQFWQSWDPTFGYVHYVNQSVADQFHMINITDNTVAWGVDTTQILNPSANLGRLSIRLTSLQSWTHGLFVLDLAHMPDATCGVWPSFWTLGGTGTWPTSGEIDIIEFTNTASNDLMALHTSEGCTVAGADQSGTLLSSDCGAAGGITGCTVSATEPDNSADGFNSIGGGVYAMEWTSAAIRIWFFPRDAIPTSILSGALDINAFGLPAANFQGDCDMDAHFYNHSLVFNTDFCGQWAGPTFQSEGCPQLDPSNSWQSCNDFVALNPAAFDESYWEVNYLNVYQTLSGTTPTSSTSLTSVTPAILTSSVSTALSGAQGRSSTPTESIAATTPTVLTGSFTATSSVLSVLSSLSASSLSVSLASGASTTSIPSSSVPLSGTAPNSSTSTFTNVSTIATTLSSTSSSNVASTLSSSSVCTGTICTSYVVIVQTVTINARNARATGTAEQRKMAHSSNDAKFGRCDFTVHGSNDENCRKTDFACTFTQPAIFDGVLATASFTLRTALHSSEPLLIGTPIGELEIDRFVLNTESVACFTPSTDATLTGSFTPSGTSINLTTITARPLQTTPGLLKRVHSLNASITDASEADISYDLGIALSHRYHAHIRAATSNTGTAPLAPNVASTEISQQSLSAPAKPEAHEETSTRPMVTISIQPGNISTTPTLTQAPEASTVDSSVYGTPSAKPTTGAGSTVSSANLLLLFSVMMAVVLGVLFDIS